MPPVTVCAMLPSLLVLQLTGNPLKSLGVPDMAKSPGCPTLKLVEAEHPLASVTESRYTPASNAVISVLAEENPLGPVQAMV